MYTVYATYKNADDTEGRGPMVLDKIFFEKHDAYEYINQQSGVMGRTLVALRRDSWDGLGDWEVKPLQIMQHLQDGEEYERQKARESGLAKLTGDERRALGL